MASRALPGTSAVEVLVAVMVCAAIAIPMLTLMQQERDTEQRSRFEYVALLAARDAAFAARALVAAGRMSPDAIGTALDGPLAGHPLDKLGDKFVGTKPGRGYYAEQQRIRIGVQVQPELAGASKRLRLATVSARWMDPAAIIGNNPAKEKRTVIELVAGILKPPGMP
jgi:hypothetical protein